MTFKTLVLAASAAVFVAGAAQAQTLKLIAQDPAATSSAVQGINNAGQMTGAADVGGKVVAFVRDASGAYTTFSVNNNNFTFGRGIANNGDVLGYATNNGTTGDDTFARAANGTVTLLQNPNTSSALHGIASAENASGVIVGDFQPNSGLNSAFILEGGSIDIFQAPGSARTSARGVADDGTVAGFAAIGAKDEAFLLTGGAFSFFLDPNATSGNETFFESINGDGSLAVGQWKDTSGNDHPFTFNTATDTFTELDSLGLVGFDAWGVNNRGDVVLSGSGADGIEKSFLYNATGVPEPATWAMMLTGFFGLGSMLRRRRAALAV